MKLNRIFPGALAGVVLVAARLLADDAGATNTVTTTPAVYVPDVSHMNDPLPDGILAWDEISKSTDAAAGQHETQFTFNFTNVTPGNVVIMDVHPSCGCTTAQLPERPWTIPAGGTGQIGLTVNLEGKSGVLFKTASVTTDKGKKDLMLRITILPPAVQTMTEAERARGLQMAKADRQAVFKGDCVTCHVKPAEGKYGQELYALACGICHEAEHRATMVTDLHTLKTATSVDFWRTWIANGKPGSLMPAFATAQGGPLTDIQIASLAAYLDSTIPSHVAPPPQ